MANKAAEQWASIAGENRRLLTRALEKLRTVEVERDEARALILAYAAWDGHAWPAEVERVPEEQALLDYAAGLGGGK